MYLANTSVQITFHFFQSKLYPSVWNKIFTRPLDLRLIFVLGLDLLILTTKSIRNNLLIINSKLRHIKKHRKNAYLKKYKYMILFKFFTWWTSRESVLI